MALTPEQRQKLLDAKAQGLTKEQALARVFASAPNTARSQGRYADVGEDLGSAFMGAGRDLNQRAGNIIEGFRAGMRGEQTQIETGAQMAGNILGGAGDLAFRGIQAAVTPFMKESEERAVESGFNRAVDATGLPQAMQNTSPRTQRNIIGGLGLFEGATAGAGSFASQPLSRGFQGIFNRVLGRGSQAVPSPTQTVEQVVDTAARQLQRQANDPNLPPRAKEEAANAAMSFKERYVGLTPDVKARLQQMGPQKLQEYLDAVHMRNIDDTAPTPYEVGSRNVQTAQERLEEALRNTGSGIGQSRQKLATYRFQQPQVETIERIFNGELSRLKLTVRNGEVVQPTGTISSANTGDVIALNSLYKDFLTFKQSPTLENAIALRTNLDGKIKFGKSARDVSNEVDPLSRSVRATIAKEAAKLVGKENAAELQKYSDFMDAYGDLKSYTDRAAGGEYLLRLVLSGRGGDARQLIQTVKDYTGIDLMNDATAMKVSTELLGNEQTKNLFRQEVTRAGYDVASIFTGGPTGMLEVAAKRLLDLGINAEDVLKATAAGAGGYLIMTYSGEDGIAPAGLAVLAAMPSKGRKQALEQASKISKSTGKPLKLTDADRDAVDAALSKTTFDKLQQPGMDAGGSTIDLGDIEELDRLKAAMEKPSGLTDVDYIEARALLEKYNLSFNKGATPQTTALLEEARKYKSAEEFYKARKANHFTNEKFENFDIGKTADQTIWFTTKNTPEGLAATGGDIKMERALVPKKVAGWNEYDAKSLSELQQEGYDLVELPDDGFTDYIVLDPSVIKTRAEIENVWKQVSK